MRRPDREPVAIFGMVALLLLASVAPFAVPALRADAGGAPGRGPSAVPDPSLAPVPNGSGSGGPADHPSGSGWASERGATTVDCSRADEARSTPSYGQEGDDVTGDGVAVAVVDPTGFDVDAPGLADQVAGTASFDRGGDLGIRNGGHDHHGTESARLVARTAPEASLYLANFRTARDFTEAVAWAIERDVDVLVAPTVFYATPNDGSAPVSRAVANAAEAGITVVVPTGNVADRHWEGTYDGGGAVEFAPNDTRMHLVGDGRRVELWLWWNRTTAERPDDFSVELYRETDHGPRRVAESEAYPTGPVGTSEVLTETVRTNDLLPRAVETGSLFVRIEGPPNATHHVELVVATHRLERPTRAGSVMAPATAGRAGVVTVGAGQRSTGRPLRSSGRGPTNDGRVGVDVIAPATTTEDRRFAGTSAAASYTGGVAALLAAVTPSLTPAEVEAILTATADGDGESPAAGHGMVDAEAAVACAAALDGV